MSEILLSADALTVPRAQGQGLILDMRRIHRAEARLFELQSVTRAKAGELLHCFIEAFSEAKANLAQLRGEYGRAKQLTRRVRGRIVLDRAIEVLKARGLVRAASPAGSEDLRDSVVEDDPEYVEAFDRFCQVEAAMEHMEGKVETIKMAYFSVSELIKGTDLTRRDTSGGVGDDDPGSFTRTEKIKQFIDQHSVAASEAETYEDSGFGVPKI